MKRKIKSQVASERLISDRRDRIIKAAIEVFRRHGFHVATTTDIAREAGLTQSNLYNYVSSKQDVLFLVCEHLVGMYDKVLDEVSLRHEDPHTRLVEAIRSIIGIISTYKGEVQLLYHETHALEKRDRKIILTSISAFISRCEGLVKDYEKHSSVSVENSRLIANLMSFIPAIIALRNWDFLQNTPKDMEDAVLKFVLAGIGIPEPESKGVAPRKVPSVPSARPARRASSV